MLNMKRETRIFSAVVEKWRTFFFIRYYFAFHRLVFYTCSTRMRVEGAGEEERVEEEEEQEEQMEEEEEKEEGKEEEV